MQNIFLEIFLKMYRKFLHGCSICEYGHFNLFALSDIPEKLRQAQKKLSRNFGDETRVLAVQTDITQMYTFLDHEQIIQALIWLCRKANSSFQKKGKRKCIQIPKHNNIKTEKLQNEEV